MRQNLSRFDDPALLLDLYEEAHERITGSVGPDRSKEVAALEPRADVEAAQNELSATNDAIRRAGEERTEAAARLREADHDPIRAHLPGRLGEGTRDRADRERGSA